MTPRAFLVRGLLAGLLAGVASFLVAHQVGEPHVEAAIALEEKVSTTSASGAHSHEHGDEHGHEHGDERPEAVHGHGDDGTVVSRHDQRTWGLLTGTLTVALALGGVLGLVAAGAAGRLGPMTIRQSTAVVSTIGFVAFALVPFLKYPATPPGAGDPDAIGARTGAYFGFLLVSLVAAVAVTLLAARLRPRFGGYSTVVGAACAYLVVVVVAGGFFPAVDEVGDFPADTLWSFRLGSLMTLATMWAVLGVVLTGLLGRLHDQAMSRQARRELARSL